MRIQDIPWLDFTVPQKKLDVSVAATFDRGGLSDCQNDTACSALSGDDSAGQRRALLDNGASKRPHGG